jgi:lipoate-protein ligase A
MTAWKVIDTGEISAEENMGFDVQLLETEQAQSVLHFYEWKGDCATYGYFTDPAKLINVDNAQKLSLNLARRPTGGGIVFHMWDMAFSVVVPAHSPNFSTDTLKNYAFVNNAVLAAVKEFLGDQPPLALISEDLVGWDTDCSRFCMARPTKYDVMWEGKKVAGAAQRKTKLGFLHQGTIALTLPPLDYLEQILLPGTLVKEAMLAHTCPLLGPLLGSTASTAKIQAAKQQLRQLLTTHLTSTSL